MERGSFTREPAWGGAHCRSGSELRSTKTLNTAPSVPLPTAKLSSAVPSSSNRATPRIGIRKAADWPLRFLVKGNRFVSKG